MSPGCASLHDFFCARSGCDALKHDITLTHVLSPSMVSGCCKCMINFPQEAVTMAQCASPRALIKKSDRSNHCQTGQHKLKEATRCSGGVKCRLCSTAPRARDAKHVSAAAKGVLVRTITAQTLWQCSTKQQAVQHCSKMQQAQACSTKQQAVQHCCFSTAVPLR